MINKDLGLVTAYAYAVSKGYTGTEDEFAELMASYASVAEQAEESAEDSEAWAIGKRGGQDVPSTDATYHNNSKYYADQAGTSASTAASSASAASASESNAAASASSAAGSASSATTSAATATEKAGEASTSATAAGTSATNAAGSATNAASSATAASASATAAGNAQTAAETAQGKAEDAQEAAETAAQSVSQSAAQISQNASDISDLKSAISSYARGFMDSLDVTPFIDTVTGTQYAIIPVNIEPGNYILTIDSIVSSDTDRNWCSFMVYNGTTQIYHIGLDRNVAIKRELLLPNGATSLRFYASEAGTASVGDTFTYNNVKITYKTHIKEDFDDIKSLISYSADFSDLNFMQGIWNDSGVEVYSEFRLHTQKMYCKKPHIQFTAPTNYYISVAGYKNNVRTTASEWKASYNDVLSDIDYVAFILKKTADGIEQKIKASDVPSFTITVDGEIYLTKADVIHSIQSELNETNKRIDINNLLLHSPVGSHMFKDSITSVDAQLIPSESIHEIEIAKRLGHKWIECHAQKTATWNKYIVIHGVQGYLGYEMEDLNGNVATNVKISETSYNDLKNNYVYRSTNPKYKTHVSSLEEFMQACKSADIIPMVYCEDQLSINICKKYFGNNFIWYASVPKRDMYSGPIVYWDRGEPVEYILGMFESIGAPFMYGIDNDRTTEQKKAIIEGAHERGCLAGFAGTYGTMANNFEFANLGADFNSSGWECNSFDYGNIDNLYSDINFNDFSTDGTVVDGSLSLTDGQYISSANQGRYFLSKCQIDILFVGQIDLHLSDGVVEITSDGTSYCHLSRVSINEIPNFSIYAMDDVTIMSITYRSSFC